MFVGLRVQHRCVCLRSLLQVQVVALVRGTDLWVANAGDSRCVASRRGRALALTHDHKPTDTVEMQRIAKVGATPAEGTPLLPMKKSLYQPCNILRWLER